MILSIFQDLYRQELAAEEDVYRTLPFFATALGLLVAALNFAAAQLPEWAALTHSCGRPTTGIESIASWFRCGWPVIAPAAFLTVASIASIGVLWSLASATKRRNYSRVGPESSHLARARQLQDYHRALGLTEGALDSAIVADLRDQLLEDYARVVSRNRNFNLKRYSARARAISFLMWSLFMAIAATMIIGVTAKFGLMLKVGP